MPHVLILFIFKHYKQVSDDQVTTCQKCSILRKSFAILFFNEERKIIDTQHLAQEAARWNDDDIP